MTSRNLIRTDFWFPDGTIILIAQGSAGFKVHKGQLARHSEVFADLFALPQPPNVSEAHNEADEDRGCPYVHLPDSPSDVFYFLGAIYDGFYFSRTTSTQAGTTTTYSSSFAALSSVLRLSTKYLVDHLRHRCLARLSLDWPSTLAEWDAREARFTTMLTATSEHTFPRYAPREHTPHPIHVILLALEMHVHRILPAAIYDLSRYNPSKIMAGPGSSSIHATTFERLAAQLNPNHWKASSTKAFGGVRLPRHLLIQTLRGRESSQRFLAEFIERELAAPLSASCLYYLATYPPSSRPQPLGEHPTAPPSPPLPCTQTLHLILLSLLRGISGITTGRDADPLFSLAQALEMVNSLHSTVPSPPTTSESVAQSQNTPGPTGTSIHHQPPPDPNPLPSIDPSSASSNRRPPPPTHHARLICTRCKSSFRHRVVKAREDVWARLGVWFGLTTGSSTTVATATTLLGAEVEGTGGGEGGGGGGEEVPPVEADVESA